MAVPCVKLMSSSLAHRNVFLKIFHICMNRNFDTLMFRILLEASKSVTDLFVIILFTFKGLICLVTFP